MTPAHIRRADLGLDTVLGVTRKALPQILIKRVTGDGLDGFGQGSEVTDRNGSWVTTITATVFKTLKSSKFKYYYY
jgi:hypothetical protein